MNILMLNSIINFINNYVFWYPVIMSIIWIIGGLLFYNTKEKHNINKISKGNQPMVSLLIPCYNESSTIANTIEKCNSLNYSNYEIIAINDGSSDNTSEILSDLCLKYDKLRVIDLKENNGKANALSLGLLASKGEYLVCIDADAYLDKDALNYMIPHFITKNNSERVGAVTGNPRVLNKGSLLAKIQVCEFSSIVNMIKRTQRVLGKVMTVSGVIVAFRKKALLDVGLWDKDMVTDDIAVTWKLQKRFWDIRYEPRAICWMLCPETVRGLICQRRRWSQGGIEVILRHFDIFKDIRQRRLYLTYIEYVLSIVWTVLWAFLLIYSIIEAIVTKDISNLKLISNYGVFLTLICSLQFMITMLLDNKYETKSFKYYFYSIWYSIIYWYINAFVVLSSLPKALSLRKRSGKNATWVSPDRGTEVSSDV